MHICDIILELSSFEKYFFLVMIYLLFYPMVLNPYGVYHYQILNVLKHYPVVKFVKVMQMIEYHVYVQMVIQLV
jgi:hypothetical protein